MSWDVIFLKTKINLEGGGADSDELGNRGSIIHNLTALFPTIDFSDKSWGLLSEELFSVEFNIGDEDIVNTLIIHIRGGGNPLPIIKTICDSTGWLAMDGSTSEYIDTENISSQSWKEFQTYRDKII